MGRTQRNDRTDKLAEAHDRLAAAVEALVTGDDWQAFLTMAAKLHGYSANNVLLILSQAPWASQVAGYQTWKQVGRQVRAGEKGIAILAPCRYRSVGDDNDGDDGAGQPEAQPGRIVVRGFRVVHVFDPLSQESMSRGGHRAVQRRKPEPTTESVSLGDLRGRHQNRANDEA
jgi:antirestriction protein ArdC